MRVCQKRVCVSFDDVSSFPSLSLILSLSFLSSLPVYRFIQAFPSSSLRRAALTQPSLLLAQFCVKSTLDPGCSDSLALTLQLDDIYVWLAGALERRAPVRFARAHPSIVAYTHRLAIQNRSVLRSFDFDRVYRDNRCKEETVAPFLQLGTWERKGGRKENSNRIQFRGKTFRFRAASSVRFFDKRAV